MHTSVTFRSLLLVTGLAGLLGASGCEEKKTETPPPAPTAPTAPTAPAAPTPPTTPAAATPGSDAGSTAAAPAAAQPAAPTGPTGKVKGVVTFSGKPPEMQELKRDTDPFCAKTKMKDEEVMVKNGKLKNVVVHINGAPAMPAPTKAVVLDQNNCMYSPRVATAVTNQNVEIKNSDQTFHNVHGYKGTSTLFNLAQIPSTPNITKTFTDNGTLIKFKCDVHQWMTAYLWVQNNPLAAVTNEDGSFEIDNVPPGKYEIEAWQERYGSKKGTVTVAADKTAEVKFDYTGKETAPAK